jgi:hypothetical protein
MSGCGPSIRDGLLLSCFLYPERNGYLFDFIAQILQSMVLRQFQCFLKAVDDTSRHLLADSVSPDVHDCEDITGIDVYDCQTRFTGRDIHGCDPSAHARWMLAFDRNPYSIFLIAVPRSTQYFNRIGDSGWAVPVIPDNASTSIYLVEHLKEVRAEWRRRRKRYSAPVLESKSGILDSTRVPGSARDTVSSPPI